MDDNTFYNIIAMNQKNTIQKIIDCNQYTKKFGVVLSEQDVVVLLESRKYNLKEQERIEFGEGILTKLIKTFCDSPYIYQDNYVDSIDKLQEIFYLYKNETMDELTDDELLSYMKEQFDGTCQGSLEYLEETCLDEIGRKIRREGKFYFGSNYEEE